MRQVGTEFRRATTGAVACLMILVGVASCSSSPGARGRSQSQGVTSDGSLSAYQRHVIDNRHTVSVAQYQAAFNAFSACVAKSGGRVQVLTRDATSGLITYETGGQLGTPDDPDIGTPEGRCYHEYFDEIEFVFQTTDPAVLQYEKQQNIETYNRDVRPCLLKNHKAAPSVVTPGTSQFGQLLSEYQTLKSEGRC